MKKFIPFVLLFVCSLAWAGEKELNLATANAQKSGIILTAQDEENLLLKGWRDRREGEFDPPVSSLVRPSDYENDTKRGTVEFYNKWKNYSYHKIKIKNGTVIDGEMLGGCNFTQIAPLTDAVIRDDKNGHNLTIKNCNLTNVKTYDDWILESCNNNQVWRRGEEIDGNTYYDCYNDECGEKVARSSKDAEKLSKEELQSKKPILNILKPSIKVLE